MLRLLLITCLLLLVGFGIVPFKAWGQVVNPGIRILNPLGVDTFTEAVEKIAEFIFGISIPITAIVFLAGAYQFMTAAGDPEKLKSARATLLWAAIGFALVLISFSVVTIVRQVLEL